MDRVHPVDEVVAGERHREHRIDALGRVDLDRVLGHREDDDRRARPPFAELLGDGHAAHPALEQRVDDDDVGLELLDLAPDLGPVRHDIQQLDLRLGVEEAADVLGDLRDVLDDEEADLVTAGHRGRVYQGATVRLRSGSPAPPDVPTRPSPGDAHGRTAMRMARSAPGPCGSRS